MRCDGYEPSSAYTPASQVKLVLCTQQMRIVILLVIFFLLVLLVLSAGAAPVQRHNMRREDLLVFVQLALILKQSSGRGLVRTRFRVCTSVLACAMGADIRRSEMQ